MLNAKNLGISAGIIWAFWLFVFPFINLQFGYAPLFADLLTQVYPGYAMSTTGAFIGLLYGFLDAFFFFFILSWIYNKLNG